MNALITAAQQARDRAYAPYSRYKVGAAVLDGEGRLWVGCNVENASYGATMCAERSAIFSMVLSGSTSISMLAVATEDAGVPCGMCLQVLTEFVQDPETLKIFCVKTGDHTSSNDQAPVIIEYTLHDLLPHGFKLRT